MSDCQDSFFDGALELALLDSYENRLRSEGSSHNARILKHLLAQQGQGATTVRYSNMADEPLPSLHVDAVSAEIDAAKIKVVKEFEPDGRKINNISTSLTFDYERDPMVYLHVSAYVINSALKDLNCPEFNAARANGMKIETVELNQRSSGVDSIIVVMVRPEDTRGEYRSFTRVVAPGGLNVKAGDITFDDFNKFADVLMGEIGRLMPEQKEPSEAVSTDTRLNVKATMSRMPE